MTKLTSDLDIVVHGATGATLKINAGDIKEVHDNLLELAIAAGAYEYGSSEPAQTEQATDKNDVIKAAIAELLKDGDPANFDKAGKPKLTVLTKLVGFRVSTAMRDSSLIE